MYEAEMLECDRVDISIGIFINKTDASKECNIFHYWYILDYKFKYKPYLCNVCHDLMEKSVNFTDVAILLLKKVVIEFIFGIWIKMMQLASWIILPYMTKRDHCNLLSII